MSTSARFFFGIGAFIAVAGVVYWFGSYEGAGTTMLAAAAGLALFCAAYLWLQVRRADPDEDAGEGEPAGWAPHASVWPFWIGVAGFFLTNGLIVGSWFLVPGVILLLAGVVGYAAQTRARST